MTKVVADTGDFTQIKKYQPQDATTNPSLLLKAVLMPEYDEVVKSALSNTKDINKAMLNISTAFGVEILKVVPGRVSTEVDARLSFDCEKTIEYARELIASYQAHGVDKDRVLIKIASTWEGIKAAEILEKEGVCCNLTLMFDLVQAIACAQSNVYLISPFVGRITDWYMKQQGQKDFPDVAEDKGVQSVKEIYQHYKKFGYQTVVMGASFRHVGQIEALAGCDALTISPELLAQLESDQASLVQQLSKDAVPLADHTDTIIDEKMFRWAMNQNPMATEKLAEGIRKFAEDTVKLESIISQKIK
ncbi:transaldolase [Facilibium subflavum]|uniref:transaldolase n=1 Tax=Facilibium subflavum TaxID=2219058 RepID=UPI001F44B2FB